MKALLIKLKKLNAVITQNEDGIFVDPIDEIPGEVYDEIIANADEIFDMVKEIEEIIISIEKWAGDNPDLWVTAHKRFNKDHQSNPLIYFDLTNRPLKPDFFQFFNMNMLMIYALLLVVMYTEALVYGTYQENMYMEIGVLEIFGH